MSLKFKKLDPDAIIPTRGSEEAAGVDFHAMKDFILQPGERMLVKTGLGVAVPKGTYLRIAPRSGLAFKHGIDVLAGVVDSDYRGEVGVILINTNAPSTGRSVQFKAGDKIAQGIVERIELLDPVEVENLDETVRGEGGFGSTDKKE